MTAEGVPPRVAEVEAQLVAEGSPLALTTIEIDGMPIDVFATRSANLRELLAKSVRFGDAEYLVATDGESVRRITFAAHERAVASLAKVMSERYGVRKGDRVAILGANSIDWIITFWATISLGAIACALNGWWTGPEIEYAIGYTEPKLLVADRKRIARMDGAAAGSPSGRELQASRGGADVPIVVMEDDFPTLTTAHPDAALADVELGDDDPAILLFTSGTTGRPKGAVHTHGNVCSLLAMLFFQGARAAMTASPPAPGAPPPTPACQFMTSPLFHVSGLHTGAVMFMATGTRSVWWMGRFDPRKVAPVIERERCTGWSITETVLHRFVHDPDVAAGNYDFTLVKTLGGGGSAVPPATQELARQVFPNAARSMGFGYGLTECTALATTNFGEELIVHPTSVGRPLPTVTLEIRDPDDPSAPALAEGEEGEVWIRSPMVMREYWRMPEATAEVVFPGGWLRTGDWGRLVGGRLFLASRRKDLILRGGENVYPAEIEARLVEHPTVDEVAVVGVPDPELGQAVKAIVVPRTAAIDLDELRDFCAAGLAYYKVPTEWQLRRDPLPRNAMGKLLRDALDDDVTDAARRFVEE